MGSNGIGTLTKVLIAVGWIVVILVIVAVVQTTGSEKAELDKQDYLELASKYEAEADAEYKLYEEYTEKANTYWRVPMSDDDKYYYDSYKRQASYHYNQANNSRVMAQEYRYKAAGY